VERRKREDMRKIGAEEEQDGDDAIGVVDGEKKTLK
jgi:hypothetical protein